MGNIIKYENTTTIEENNNSSSSNNNSIKKPEVPSRDTDGYRMLSKKVEEMKLDEKIKEYIIIDFEPNTIT